MNEGRSFAGGESGSRPDFVLGVDGGNSKTVALIADLGGNILGAGRAGCSDIYGARSAEAAVAEIEGAVDAAADRAGVSPQNIVRGVFSLAGADWPEDFELLRNELGRRTMAQRVLVLNDAFGALRAGSRDGNGVAVVCGTGAAVGARAPDGQMWHSSWWQEPQGSRQLAEKALRAVLRSALGIDAPTSLTGRALCIFGAQNVEEILHLLTARGAPRRPELSLLTTALLEEAESGDATAGRVITEHGSALGEYALAAARKVGLAGGPFTLVLAGGVLRAGGSRLSEAITERVLVGAPQAVPVRARYEPAVGAVLLALEAAGVTVGGQVEERIRATLPAPELFAAS